jgi:hypothetical protein
MVLWAAIIKSQGHTSLAFFSDKSLGCPADEHLGSHSERKAVLSQHLNVLEDVRRKAIVSKGKIEQGLAQDDSWRSEEKATIDRRHCERM